MGGWSARGIPACRAGLLFLRDSRGQPPFFPGGVGVFTVPVSKTEIFLTAPEGRNPAALSDLSDERSRRSRCVRSSGRVGRIPAFRDS